MHIGFFSNPLVFAGVAAMIILQLGYTCLPLTNRIFQSAPITAGDWVQIPLVSITVYLVVAFEKAYRRRKTKLGEV